MNAKIAKQKIFKDSGKNNNCAYLIAFLRWGWIRGMDKQVSGQIEKRRYDLNPI